MLLKKKNPKRKRALDYSSGRVIKVMPLSHSEEIKRDNRIWQPCSQTQPEPRGVDGSPSHIRDERLESSTVVNLVIFQGQANVIRCSACFGHGHAWRCMKCAASIHHRKLAKGVDGRRCWFCIFDPLTANHISSIPTLLMAIFPKLYFNFKGWF